VILIDAATSDLAIAIASSVIKTIYSAAIKRFPGSEVPRHRRADSRE
jgi:hypothetical protein